MSILRPHLPRLLKLFAATIISSCLLLIVKSEALAALCTPTFPSSYSSGQAINVSFDLSGEPSPNSIPLCTNNPDRQKCYIIKGCQTIPGGTSCQTGMTTPLPNQTISGGRISASYTPSNSLGNFVFSLETWNPTMGGYETNACTGAKWTVNAAATTPSSASCGPGTFQVVGVRDGQEISNYTRIDPIRIKFNGANTSGFVTGGFFSLLLTYNGSTIRDLGELVSPIAGNQMLTLNGSLQNSIDLGVVNPGANGDVYRIEVTDSNASNYLYCHYNFRISEDGNNEVTQEGLVEFNVCEQIPDPALKAKCTTCFNGGTHIWTAVGCIETNTKAIVRTAVQLGLSIAGGVATLMILAAAFLFSTSQGDPKRTNEARDLMTSAIIGLLFIIFSVTILQFIGVTILQIPGFGSS